MSIPEMAAVESGDGPAVPVHVAIIMDGNGRWATSRGLPRIEGHRRGVEALRRTVRDAGDLGIQVLTIYSFSTENWSRPQREVNDLMGLVKRYLREDLDELREAGVRVRMIGDREVIDPDILRLVADAEARTRDNTRLQLVVAFNYGGRQEIAQAAAAIARAAAEGQLSPDDVNAATFEGYLNTHGLPDPDLIIRTSGELRLSNFLLWQSAYAEFVVLPVHWPDFSRKDLLQAIEEFQRRHRRFGGLEARVGA